MAGAGPGCSQNGGRAFGTEVGVEEVHEDVVGEDEDVGGDVEEEGEEEAAEVARRRPCPLCFPGRCLEMGGWRGVTEAEFPYTPPLRTTSLLLADR